MDQDETWHAGRPRPRPHCVRWGPSFPTRKRHIAQPSHQFSADVRCGQMAGLIKMPLGTEVGFISGHIVLDRDPTAPPPKKRGGAQPTSPIFGPCLLWPSGWMDEDATWSEVSLGQGHIMLDGDTAPLRERGRAAPSFRFMSSFYTVLGCGLSTLLSCTLFDI